MEVFTLLGKIVLDGADKVKDQLEQTGITSQQAADKIKKLQDGLKLVGGAFTAVGAAGMAMVSSSKEMNAQLSQIGITLGISTAEMRKLALEVTNVTFPLKSVIATFDLLSKAGVRNTDDMKDAANAFDALADATGSTAEGVANILIPAFKNFGINIADAGSQVDKFTWLSKNTTVSIEEFGSAMNYVAAYGQDLNLTIDDMVGIMAALEAKGITGSATTRVFRTAISQAASGAMSLNDALHLSQDAIDGFKTELDDAKGITEEYADAANTQYTIMDKVKQAFSELTLRASGFLEPLEPILAAMTALGPVMMLLSTEIVRQKIAWIAHTVAVNAAKLAHLALKAAMAIGPWGIFATAIGLSITALIGLKNALKGVVINSDTCNSALEISRRRLKEIEDAGYGATQEANNLRKAIERLNDALAANKDNTETIIRTNDDFNNKLHERWMLLNAITVIEQQEGELSTDMQTSLTNLYAQYINLDDELRNYLANLDNTSSIYNSLPPELQAYTDALIAHKEEVSGLTNAINSGNQSLDFLKKKLAEAEKAYKTAQDTQAGFADDITILEGKISDTSSALDTAKSTLSEYQTAVDNAKAKVAEFEQKISDANYELQSLMSPKWEGSQAYEDQIADIDLAIKKLELQKLTTEGNTDEINAQIEALRIQKEILELTRDIEFDPLTYAAKEAVEEIQGLNKEMAPEEVMARIAELGEMISSSGELGQGLSEAQDELTKANSLLEEQTQLVSDLTTELEGYQSELDILNSKVDEALANMASETAALATQIDKLKLAIQEAKDALDELNNTPIVGAPAETGAIGTQNLAGFQHGGVIPEPTLLTSLRTRQPYAIAGEAGREYISPQMGGFKTANIVINLDGRTIAQVIGQPLVDIIRLQTGLRI